MVVGLHSIRIFGKFQIISRELELAVRGADKPCPDCGGSVLSFGLFRKKNVGQQTVSGRNPEAQAWRDIKTRPIISYYRNNL